MTIEGFSHKCQLARRLRGFEFHSIFLDESLRNTSVKSSTQQSAITGKIKIKYVMQILKLAAFLAGVSVFVMIIKMERKVFFRFTKVKSEALGLMSRKMTIFHCCGGGSVFQIANDSRSEI